MRSVGGRTRTAATIFSSALRLRSSLSSLAVSISVGSFLTPPISTPFSAGAAPSDGVGDGRYCLRSATMTLALSRGRSCVRGGQENASRDRAVSALNDTELERRLGASREG
jgi:hypothetical protein